MSLAAGKGLTPTRSALRERCEQDARDYELSKALFPKLFSSQAAKHPQTDAGRRDAANGPGSVEQAGSSQAPAAQALSAATPNPGGETGAGGHTALGPGLQDRPQGC